MIERKVEIDGKTVRMRASALIPRLYRARFGRDMIADMMQLRKAYAKAERVKKDAEAAYETDLSDAEREELDERVQAAQLSSMDLMIFENVAWLMVKHGAEFKSITSLDETGEPYVERVLMSGDMAVGDSPEEWLDSIDGMFSIYEIMPVILELWGENNRTTSVPRKK